MAPDLDDRARTAAAAAALELIGEGMTIGLGSGRAVWHLIEAIAARWPEGPPLRAVCASDVTAARAEAASIELVELDGAVRLELALDGADEVDPQLGLIKGGGAALLREKLVVDSAARFVVVAETEKRVTRLGRTRPLPVEVVRFAWPETRRRLLRLVPDASLRLDRGEGPLVTDEGHYLLDLAVPPSGDLEALAAEIKATTGVVEHGFFFGLAERALLGTPDGTVETVRPAAAGA